MDLKIAEDEVFQETWGTEEDMIGYRREEDGCSEVEDDEFDGKVFDEDNDYNEVKREAEEQQHNSMESLMGSFRNTIGFDRC